MKNFRIGVMGAGRGIDIAENFMKLGCEIVALCENNKKRAALTFTVKSGFSVRYGDSSRQRGA